jgi:hypothetical protein
VGGFSMVTERRRVDAGGQCKLIEAIDMESYQTVFSGTSEYTVPHFASLSLIL